MLAYILALIVGSGSFALYMAAFFFPEVHRKNDFLWSGVGLFYALVLWVCAGRITGGVLLGQTASVALLGWLGWQTFLLRRQVAPLDQQTPLPTADDVKASLAGLTSSEGRAEVAGQASRLFTQVKQGVQGAVSSATQRSRSPLESDSYIPPSLEEFGTAGQDAIERFARVAIPDQESVQSTVANLENAIADTTESIAESINGENLPDAKAAVETALETATEVAENAVAESAQAIKEVKKTIAPIAEQSAETVAETTKGFGGLFQGFNQKKQKQESKPVYVRKQFREDAAPAEKPAKPGKKPTLQENQKNKESYKKEGKPVYVRKQFRDPIPEVATQEVSEEIREAVMPDPKAQVEDAIAQVEETVAPDLTEAATSIASTVETISEAVVPDLLGNAPVEVSAEEIVEELLEDISAQEESLVLEAIAIEPTEIIEVAIAPDSVVIEPITWVAELENDPAIETISPNQMDNH
jgi:hypothetical protein